VGKKRIVRQTFLLITGFLILTASVPGAAQTPDSPALDRVLKKMDSAATNF